MGLLAPARRRPLRSLGLLPSLRTLSSLDEQGSVTSSAGGRTGGSAGSTTGFHSPRLNHSGAPRGYNRFVAIQRKTARSHRAKPRSVRQSVTIPGDLAVEVRRIAKE